MLRNPGKKEGFRDIEERIRQRVILERVKANEEPGVEVGDEIGAGFDEIVVVYCCDFGIVKDCYDIRAWENGVFKCRHFPISRMKFRQKDRSLTVLNRNKEKG